MKSKIGSLLSKKENIVIFVFILISIGFLIIIPFLPDDRPERLRNELEKQGYSVGHVEFVFVKDVTRDEWVFQSSELIFFDGEYVEYWLLTRRTIGFMWTHSRTVYYVEPYTSAGSL